MPQADMTDVLYWRARCEELEEELRQVRKLLDEEIHPVVSAMGTIAPQTPSGAVAMVAALYEAYPRALSRERLMLVRRACRHDVDPKVIDVQICRARQGLRRAGVEGPIIVTVYTAGYRMHAGARAFIAARLTEYTNLASVPTKHRG